MLLVQCDFDDTVVDGNVSEAIREVFAPDEWRSMEREFLEGKLSVEEDNIRQYPLVRATRKEIEDFVLGNVVMRFGFEQFVEYCKAVEIKLVIVSSGLDMYIEPTLDLLGFDHIEVHAAKAEVTQNGVAVSYTDPAGRPLTRGFKESYLRHFKEQGHTVIYVGDGQSDIAAATEADFVIARAELETHLREAGLPHQSFESFEDIAKHVDKIRVLIQEGQ